MFAIGEAWTAIFLSVISYVGIIFDTFRVGELNDIFALKDVDLLYAGDRVDLHPFQAVM